MGNDGGCGGFHVVYLLHLLVAHYLRIQRGGVDIFDEKRLGVSLEALCSVFRQFRRFLG